MPEREQDRAASSGEARAPAPAGPLGRRWALAAGLVLAVVGFYASGLHRYVAWDYVRAHLSQLREQVRQDPVPAVLLFFLVYVAVTALSLPAAAVLTLLGGALFDRWLATAVVSLAATLGATLAFLSSRYLFREWVRYRLGRRLETLDRGVERDGPYYLLALRLVPAFPFFLINLGMGLTRMPVGTFAWVSFVGMLPGTFVYANAGTALGSIDAPKEVLSPDVLLALALLAVVPLGLRLLIRRRPPPGPP